MTNQTNLWASPWRYKQSMLVAVALLLVGIMLQSTVGFFDYYLLQSPVNIWLAAVITASIALVSIRSKSRFYQWFSGVPFAVSLLSVYLFLLLVMGIVPQATNNHHSIYLLGMDRMTDTWYFVLIQFVIILSLGTLIARRLKQFRWKDYAFYLNHIGLWLVLLAGGLGAADMRRYVMHVREGEVEWRVYSENKDVLELPLGIQLNDFILEEYPPKLGIINRESGEALPVGKPRFFQIDPKQATGSIGKWNLEVQEYIHEAVRSSDSTYRAVPMPGSCPAALVKVTDNETGETKTGWISAGNYAQLYMVLNLTDELAVVMTAAEPKRFVSDIVVYTESGEKEACMLEVNKPLRIGNWTVYQYSYDAEMGKASPMSSFELVHDPWLPAVYTGIIMLMIGCFCLFIQGKKRTKDDNVE